MILVGTSGFSYADWVGPFYPVSLSKQDFLRYYRQYFRVCELNFSYYRVPTADSLSRMVEKSEGQVEFVLKPGQICLIQPGEVHRVMNKGDEDLEFLAFCVPAWEPEDSFEV